MALVEMVCIICPMGCNIKVLQTPNGPKFTGNGCRRGELYARDEMTCPKRVVTGVISVAGSDVLLPVKTAAPVSKSSIFQVMERIRRMEAAPPVKSGQILEENIAGTGVALVATKNIDCGRGNG